MRLIEIAGIGGDIGEGACGVTHQRGEGALEAQHPREGLGGDAQVLCEEPVEVARRDPGSRRHALDARAAARLDGGAESAGEGVEVGGAAEGAREEPIEKRGPGVDVVDRSKLALERARLAAERLAGGDGLAGDCLERAGGEGGEAAQVKANTAGAHGPSLLYPDRDEALCVEVRGGDLAAFAAHHAPLVGRSEVEDEVGAGVDEHIDTQLDR